MKSWNNSLVSIAIALAAAAAAHAQTVTIKSEVPFEFQVGGHTLPSGTYFVTESNDHTIAWFSGKHVAQGLTTMRTAGEQDSQPACLIFHKYGDEYFLAQIWTGRSIGQSLPMTKREKELAFAGVPRALTIIRVSVTN